MRDNAFEAASFAQKAALRSTEEAIRNEASSSEENTNRMIPSDNPSESSTSTPMARILFRRRHGGDAQRRTMRQRSHDAGWPERFTIRTFEYGPVMADTS